MTYAIPTPLISVIMPCLNAKRHIQAAFDSLLAQTFDDFELILVVNSTTHLLTAARFEGRDHFDADAIRARPEPYRWMRIVERAAAFYQDKLS